MGVFLDSMLYSGCSDVGGDGTRSCCADFRTDAVTDVKLSRRTEVSGATSVQLRR
jgi:hypothetical protein